MKTVKVCYEPQAASHLQRKIRQMAYGDALVMLRSGWSLEYEIPDDEGFPNYRLYYREHLVRIQFIRAGWQLVEIQEKLAAYLSLMGFTKDNTEIREGAARGPLSVDKRWRLPKFFPMEYSHVRITMRKLNRWRRRPSRLKLSKPMTDAGIDLVTLK